MSIYDHVSLIAPGLSLDRRAALVAAARSRAKTTNLDGELRAARAELDALEARVPELAPVRKRVAETESVVETKRERVATLRGRVQASNERENSTESAARESYDAAVRELAEAETERLAAREALATARQRARTARDVRARRLSLQDKVRNLERAVHDRLRGRILPVVDDAVRQAPASEATSFETADDLTAALSLARVSRVERPLVLACRRFPDEETAETWLRTPVLRL